MSVLSKLFSRSSRAQPALDHNHPLVRELKAALRTLEAMPLTTKDDVQQWYTASEEFQKRLRSEWSSIYDSLPDELEHYLVDADIRAKDPGYAKYQRECLSVLLAPEAPIKSPDTTRGK